MPVFFQAGEDLPVTDQHDVYPTIDPSSYFAKQTYRDRVVLVTGASRGIGLEAALYYARAGAAVSLVARKQETLDDSKNAILEELPGAQVLTFIADVRDVNLAKEAVQATVDRFGRLDILIANAAIARPWDSLFTAKDPSGWWDVLEVNVRGVYNFVHFAIPELSKTKGQIIIVTSVMAHLRRSMTSDYALSKHALGRFAELVALEHPDIKIFPVHPGVIKTTLNVDAKVPDPPTEDTLALPAATFLYLTSGNADYLSGRYVSANWDLGEVEANWKDTIIAENALVSKLAIPRNAL
ncbi:NAD-P-binding protein [Artomyces pyxidatus]|uniref:NAD-P-binding protein n=1 Tax=Artomyces pyxidatus TaxID=48021 RepID=A0ACB8SZV0_9AGAM|nr:NAD-P-binding protein [Artomyces pyxidatus]